MILVIFTLDQTQVQLALIDAAQTLAMSTQHVRARQTEEITPAIDALLKKNKIDLQQLSGIVVATGPGGFTAVRSGVVVANALSLALEIPVKGMAGEFATISDFLKAKTFGLALKRLTTTKANTFARPTYGAKPHITVSKPKKVQQHQLKSI